MARWPRIKGSAGVPSRNFLVHVNNINETIQFTVDSKNGNGELPFLDCPIKRNLDGNLDTTVYRKPTYTGTKYN